MTKEAINADRVLLLQLLQLAQDILNNIDIDHNLYYDYALNILKVAKDIPQLQDTQSLLQAAIKRLDSDDFSVKPLNSGLAIQTKDLEGNIVVVNMHTTGEGIHPFVQIREVKSPYVSFSLEITDDGITLETNNTFNMINPSDLNS